MLSERTHSYRARWVIPIAGPPVANGIVVVHGERIVGVHRTRRPDTVDLGEVAILPGLVNCHTHLEFSALSQPLRPMTPFTDWIRRVVEYRRSLASSPSPLEGEGARRADEGGLTAPNHVGEAIRMGLRESLVNGVTLLGDIATSGWTWDDYANGPDCVVFQELLGLTSERLPEVLELARGHVSSSHSCEHHPGLSPHAPYSIHPELFRQAVELAQAANVPLAMHLAETEAELELLADGTGEFRAMLEEFGLWQPDLFGERSLWEFLDPLSELPHALVIHGNYLNDSELRFLAQHPHLTLVYCPRTHAAFGHAPHPWRTLLNLGGSVAFGTDSRASNPDLSLWKELQFVAAAFPEVSHLELIRLATFDAARALGERANHGSLEAGKFANLIVVGPVPDDGPLLHYSLITDETQIRNVMCRGEWINGFQEPRP